MRATKKTVIQHAQEVEYDNLGLVDFAIRLVNSLLNLPKQANKVFERTVINPAHHKIFSG